MRARFGTADHNLPFVKTSKFSEELSTVFDDAELIDLLDQVTETDSTYVTKAILLRTEREFELIRKENERALSLAGIFFSEERQVAAEVINDQTFYRFYLDQLPPLSDGYTFVNSNNELIAQVFMLDDGTINVIASAPIIIENQLADKNVRVISTTDVMLGKHVTAKQFSIHANTISGEDKISLNAKNVALYSYQQCALTGIIKADENCVIKAGRYSGDIDIYAQGGLLITEYSDQRAKIIVDGKFIAVGLRLHDHPTSHIHAPNQIKLITPDFISEGIYTTNDFSLLHFKGLLDGHYFFGEKSRIDTNHDIQATEHARFFINGKFEEHSAISVRFRSKIDYYPSLTITAHEVNIGIDKIPVADVSVKRSVHFKAGITLELAGKMNLREASLHVESGQWIDIMGAINAFSTQANSLLLFNGHEIALQNNIAFNATMVVTGATTLTIADDIQIAANNLFINTPNSDVVIPKQTKFEINNEMLVRAQVYKHLGTINAGHSVSVEANSIEHYGKTKADKQRYAAEWIFSTGGHNYKELTSSAYASFFAGLNFSGSTTHSGLATFSLQFNIQNALSLKGLAVTAVTVGAAGLYFVVPPPVAAGIQFALFACMRGTMLAGSFATAIHSIQELNAYPSTNYRVKRAQCIVNLTQAGLLTLSTALYAYASYEAFAATKTTAAPAFDLVPFLESVAPSAASAFTGSNTYAIVNANGGAFLGTGEATTSVFDFNIGTFLGLSSSHTSMFAADISGNIAVVGSNHTAFRQFIAGDTFAPLGHNFVRADRLYLAMPTEWQYANWVVNSSHMVTGSPLTGFVDSTLKIDQWDAEGLVYINHSQVDIKQVNATTGLQVTDSTGRMNVVLGEKAFLNVSKSTIAIPTLAVAPKAGVEIMASNAQIETLDNKGKVDIELSVVTGKKLVNQPGQGTINVTDSVVSYDNVEGDLSPSAFTADRSAIYTPNNIPAMTTTQDGLMNQLIRYCASHRCYPTAEQWFGILGRNPTPEESQKYESIMMGDTWLETQDRALSDGEFNAIINQRPKTAEGRPNPFALQHLGAVKNQLFSTTPVVPGAIITPKKADNLDVKNFFADKPQVTAEFTFGQINYWYDRAITRHNKKTSYNVRPVNYVAPDITLEGNFSSNTDTAFYSSHDIDLKHETMDSQHHLTLYAANKINMTASHLKAATLNIIGVKGITLDAGITYSEAHDRYFQRHFLNSGYVDETTTTIQVENTSLTATDQINISSTKGEVVAYGALLQAKDEISIYGYENVKLYDVRVTQTHTISKYTLLNHTETQTLQEISTPSSLLNQKDVHIKSETGDIDGMGAEINSEGFVYADAPNGKVMLSKPVLDKQTTRVTTGILGLSNSSLQSNPDWYGLAGTALSAQSWADVATLNVRVGKETQTYKSQYFGKGSVTAKGLIINAKSVTLNNVDLNLPFCKITAPDGIFINGQRLTASGESSQTSFTFGVNLASRDLTNVSFSNSNASFQQSYYLPYVPNVGVWDIQTSNLTLNNAYVAPAQLIGHAGVVNLYSPVSSSESHSDSFGFSTGSVAFTNSNSHSEFIPIKTSLKPNDAAQFTTDKIIMTDGEVSNNISANSIQNQQQQLTNNSHNIGFGISGGPNGISDVELSNNSLNINVPVGLIKYTIANLDGHHVWRQTSHSERHETVDYEADNDDEDGYHDYEHETKVSNKTKHAANNTTKKSATRSKQRSNVDDVRDGLFYNTPSALSRLFPELTEDDADAEKPYLAAIAEGVEDGIIKTVSETYELIKDVGVIAAGNEARKGTIGNGEDCEPNKFNCVAYSDSKADLRKREETIVDIGILAFDGLYVPEVNVVAQVPGFSDIRDSVLYQTANDNLQQAWLTTVETYDDFMNLSGPDKVEVLADITTQLVVPSGYEKSFEGLSFHHYHIVAEPTLFKNNGSRTNFTLHDVSTIVERSSEVNAPLILGNGNYASQPDQAATTPTNFDVDTTYLLDNINLKNPMSPLLLNSLFKPGNKTSDTEYYLPVPKRF